MSGSLFSFRLFRMRDMHGAVDYGLWNELDPVEGKDAQDALRAYMERTHNAGGRFFLVQDTAQVSEFTARRQDNIVIERAG